MNIILYNKTVLGKRCKPTLFLDKCSFTRKENKLIIKSKIPLGSINSNEIIKSLTNQVVGHSFIFKFDYGLFNKNEELDMIVDKIDEKSDNYFEFTCLINR